MHADEIMYLFTMPIPHNETEKELAKKMIEIWTTFATYGQVQLPMLCILNIVICFFFLYFTLLFREPTPDGVTMREGIPKWPAYTHEKKEFMAINKYWSVKNDYSLVLTSLVRQ